jgi:nucleoside-triphosphatase THEP1
MFVIITGKKGIGKTAVSRRLIDTASQCLGTCGGVFTYKLPGGSMVVEDIITMKQMVLAGPLNTYRGPSLSQYSFNPAAIKFRLEAIQKARDLPVFLIDELGPLELNENNDGNVLPLIRQNLKQLKVLVMEENLLPDFLAFTGQPDAVFTVTFANRNVLADEIISLIQRSATEKRN